MQQIMENEVHPSLYASGMAICLPQEAASRVRQQHLAARRCTCLLIGLIAAQFADAD